MTILICGKTVYGCFINNLTELFQLNRIPHVYDAKLSRIRKNFIGFIGTVTERCNARFRIAL